MDVRSLHIRITGRVQGVGYRASLRRKAEQLGLVGWVRNEEDGSVVAMAQGREQALHDLVAWCHQGPPLARVDHVRHETREPGAFLGFTVIR